MIQVSVIIPTFNRAAVFERAINSVLSQKNAAFELIVVDDGSTDETTQTMKRLIEPRIRLFTQSNQGVSAARNRGIKEARGTWIAFLDSDDEWRPGKLAAQLDFLKKNPMYKICQTNEIWIRNGVRVNQMKKHEKKSGWIFEHCLPLCAISPSAVMMHLSLFDEIGLFNKNYPACEDYEMWLRVAARYPVGLIEKPYLNKFGGHADQLSRKYEAMDRFRVRALTETIQAGFLSPEQTAAARAMLAEKQKILEAGAKKRGAGSVLNKAI